MNSALGLSETAYIKQFLLHRPATRQMLWEFKLDSTVAPKIPLLRLDIAGTQASDWNEHNKSLLLDAIWAKQVEDDAPQRSNNYWFIHVRNAYGKRLTECRAGAKQYNYTEDREETEEERETRNRERKEKKEGDDRRRSRRLTRFKARKNVAQVHLDLLKARHGELVWAWEWILQVLNRLTADGMSSDETDAELGYNSVRVKISYWRRDLVKLFEFLDSQKEENATLFGKRDSDCRQGPAPYRRVRDKTGGNRSRRAALQNLPRVLYDEGWLAENHQVKMLHFSPDRFEWNELQCIVSAARSSIHH
jgi:hypothetical protein